MRQSLKIMTTTNSYLHLTGQAVRVHPQLTTDPAGKQGEYGIFIAGSEEIVFVKFEDGGLHEYEPDALIYLFPVDVIERTLSVYQSELTEDDTAAIKEILQLIKYKSYRTALERAQDATEMVQFCTTTQDLELL